ncbi:MAG: glycoside hydrolase family 78 protein [Tannerella sp.]|nr:glycoside hydrolase family 78 protein [Tannerella sp.]
MRWKQLLLILITAAGSITAAAKADFRPENLRCEYMVNPLGVDALPPHLSWVMASKTRGDFQLAYRVIVSSSPELLEKNRGDLWDTGKVRSDSSVHISYQGKPLASAGKYFWKVRIWNKEGKASGWSAPAFWSMGLLSPDAWQQAQWIAFKESETWKAEWKNHKDRELEGNVFKPGSWPWLTGKDSSIFALYGMAEPKYDPSPLFRKNFPVRKEIKEATLFICGLGYYEALINGENVGDRVLDPAWTNYEQRVMYATHDVTRLLRQGENTLGVMLGRGQYNPLCNDIWGLYKSAWIDQPKLIALLRIEYRDHTVSTLVTDPTWKTAGGPVVYDDTRHGEIYDARLEQDGWASPPFDDRLWKTASAVSWDAPRVSQMIPPIRCFDPVRPVKTFARENNTVIYDLGENVTGWADVRVKGPEGATVLVEYSETPSDRELMPELPPSRFRHDIRDPHYASFYDRGVNVRQQNGYILKGRGTERFRCHFSYKSFRFIRITAGEGVTVDGVAGIPVHTDVECTGRFSCSSPVINKIQENAVRSLKYNYHSIATDCPHREKQGWTADSYITSQAAMYNFNLAAFYSKWLTDLAGTRDENGGLCTVAPSTGYDMATSTAWPAAMVYIPLDIYHFYGDRRPVEEHFETMKAFTASSLLRQRDGKPEIISEVLGDWLAPLMELDGDRRNNTMAPPEGLSIYGTAAHFLTVRRTAETGAILGKNSEAKDFRDWSGRIAESFNREYFDKTAGTYHGDNPVEYRQAANIVPLEYGLVPEEDEKRVLQNLIADIRSKGNRLSTGFLGTLSMMEYLPRMDPELAFTLASHTRYPGWGYMIDRGADTMWESWDGNDSRNHLPFCLISGYFYKYLAGIQYDPEKPGFKHIIINPSFVKDLSHVDACHDSPYGRIGCSWKRENGEITLHIAIPANTTATVCLPTEKPETVRESGLPASQNRHIKFERTTRSQSFYHVGSGEYSFTLR